MKLYDILEWFSYPLERTAIFEMAHSRAKANEIVDSLAYQITEHVIKIILIPDSEAVEHWKGELHAWLRRLQNITLKPRSKRPPKKMYYAWLYTDPAINLRNIVIDLKREYPDLRMKNLNLDSMVQYIIAALSKDLAENQYNYERLDSYFKG